MSSTINYIKRMVHTPKIDPKAIRTEEWNIIRRAALEEVYAKTDGHCFYCGEVPSGASRTVDHFLPVEKGGSDNIDNLFPACKSCNSSKGKFTVDEWRTSRRMKIARECYGVPAMTKEAVSWLLDRGFDVFDAVESPELDFWFEDKGFVTPKGSKATGESPEWVKQEALRRVEQHRQEMIQHHIVEEAHRQGVSVEDIKALVHVGDGAFGHSLPSRPECWTALPKPPKQDGERK